MQIRLLDGIHANGTSKVQTDAQRDGWHTQPPFPIFPRTHHHDFLTYLAFRYGQCTGQCAWQGLWVRNDFQGLPRTNGIDSDCHCRYFLRSILHESVGYRPISNNDVVLKLMENVSHNGEHILAPASTPWIDFLPFRESCYYYNALFPDSECYIWGQFLPQWVSAYGTSVPVSQYRQDIETALEWLKNRIQCDLVNFWTVSHFNNLTDAQASNNPPTSLISQFIEGSSSADTVESASHVAISMIGAFDTVSIFSQSYVCQRSRPVHV